MAQAQNSPVRLANKARNSAVREFIAENQERYDQILTKHREALGLPPNPEADKKKEQIKKYHAKLAELGVTVSLDDMLAAVEGAG